MNRLIIIFVFLVTSSESSSPIREIIETIGDCTEINLILDANCKLEIALNEIISFKPVRIFDSLKIFQTSARTANVFCSNSFLELFNSLQQQHQAKFDGFFIIILQSGEKIHEILNLLWSFYITNINIIVSEKEVYSVYTFIPFSPAGCNKTDPVKIAEFKNRSFTIKPEKFFQDKFSNFHGCGVKAASFEAVYPSVIRQVRPNGTIKWIGRDLKIVEAIAKASNFRAEIFFVTPFGGWGDVYPNGSSTGAARRVMKRESEFLFGHCQLKYERSKFMDFSLAFTEDYMIYVIPPIEKDLTLRKLIEPFDDSLWFLLLVLVSCSLAIGGLLEMRKLRKVRNFIIGREIRHPFLNFLNITIGASQDELPSRNFARYILTMFILFFLIIRTLYLGGLFNVLQLPASLKDFDSIEEMAASDFKFYIIAGLEELTKEIVAMKNR